MVLAKYGFPKKAGLQGKANPAVLAGLQYVCQACTTEKQPQGATMPSAETLKAHMSGKSHQVSLTKYSMTEDPAAVKMCEEYIKLEDAHRKLKKVQDGTRSKEFLEKVKAFQAGMSKEAQKEYKQKKAEEQKKKDKQEGVVENGPWECMVTRVKCRTVSDVTAHLTSDQYKAKAEKCFGCALCGLTQPVSDEHVKGKDHQRRLARIKSMGVKLNLVANTAKGDPPPLQAKKQKPKEGKEPKAGSIEGGPWECKVCSVKCSNVNEVTTHLSSKKHKAAAQKCVGCVLCGIQQAVTGEHMVGASHMKRLARLHSMGIKKSLATTA